MLKSLFPNANDFTGTLAIANGGTGATTAIGAAQSLGMPMILGNQGLPMVMPGSGLMVANGVGTLSTALAATPAITNCYAYFAANAIATGVAAGWYYTVFSTTTAFIVYNNTYTTGTPVIPASPTPFVTASPVSYTGSSSAITAYQLSVAGNTLGLNGGLRITSAISYTNSAANKTQTITWAGSQLTTDTFTTSASYVVMAGIKNAGVTGVQYGMFSSGASGGIGAPSTNALTSTTADTTMAQTVATVLTNATPATNNLVQMNTTVELLPSVA
jgi:hypothetical protein